MKRIAASFAALLFMLSCATTSPASQDTLPHWEADKPIERAIHSTVLVQTLSHITFCTGSIVKGTGLVISAWHCFDDGEDFQLVGFHGTYFADIVHKDRWQDLAVLRPYGVDIRKRDGIPLAKHAPRMGDKVWALGHARGDRFPFTLTQGIVAFPRRDDGQVWMQSTVPLNRGMSGGPTLNADGQLVGVNLFAFDLPLAMVYGHAHHSEIMRALNKAR